jgi:hypothetical protein
VNQLIPYRISCTLYGKGCSRTVQPVESIKKNVTAIRDTRPVWMRSANEQRRRLKLTIIRASERSSLFSRLSGLGFEFAIAPPVSPPIRISAEPDVKSGSIGVSSGSGEEDRVPELCMLCSKSQVITLLKRSKLICRVSPTIRASLIRYCRPPRSGIDTSCRCTIDYRDMN